MEYEDQLIILPTFTSYDNRYLGNWLIESVVANDTLDLNESYYGEDSSNLKYVVGGVRRNFYDRIAVADIKSDEGPYLTDSNGNVQFVVTYDPILVAHTYAISAKYYGEDSRIGTSIRANFRGQGLLYAVTPSKVSKDGNSHLVTIAIAVDSPDNPPLANVEVIPSSIIIDDTTNCTLNINNSNFILNNNGEITVMIDTQNTGGECSIDWIRSNSSIYYEY